MLKGGHAPRSELRLYTHSTKGYPSYIHPVFSEFTMHTIVQNWGNSLGLRIPKTVARLVGVARGTEVEVTVDGDTIVIRPVTPTQPTLADLLGAVTAENLHTEVDTGAAVGSEFW
jgi:antitoxin MazE